MLATDGFNYLNRVAGRPLRIRYYTETIGSVWDDERTLAKSGNDLYASGILQEINTAKGSDDAFLLEEGRLKYGDSKVYVGSSIETTSGAKVFTVALSGNSATEVVYREISPGMHSPEYAGNNIWKVVYLRQLTLGSLF